jgi:hypothetical protein
MRKPLSTLALCLTLTFATGCATAPFEKVCPIPVEYTPAEREAASQELAVLCQTPTMTCRMVRDYLQLRDKVRTCR